eukprot:6203102-Pleurochrysis_carterae.AAC.4
MDSLASAFACNRPTTFGVRHYAGLVSVRVSSLPNAHRVSAFARPAGPSWRRFVDKCVNGQHLQGGSQRPVGQDCAGKQKLPQCCVCSVLTWNDPLRAVPNAKLQKASRRHVPADHCPA